MKLSRVLVPVFLLHCFLVVTGVRTLQAEDGSDLPIRLYVREVPLTVLGKQVKVLVIEQDSGVQGFEPQTSSEFKVEVINQLKEPTSIHWHGLVLPALMDGVPFVSQEPIPPNGKFWAFHCHILYHLATGMFTVLKYEGANTEFWQPEKTLSELVAPEQER
ncbi:MAG TPA: multicopper oxidase domain-containing protein [Chthoniobacterales bacterium]|jgi:hypothetical protein